MIRAVRFGLFFEISIPRVALCDATACGDERIELTRL